MSKRRILGFSFVAASVAVFIVMRATVTWVIDQTGLPNMALGPFTISDGVAMLITVGAAIGSWKAPKVHGFLTEVVDEVGKVVWPTRQEVRDSTIVVLVFVFVVASILGTFDLVWAKLTNLILSSSVN